MKPNVTVDSELSRSGCAFACREVLLPVLMYVISPCWNVYADWNFKWCPTFPIDLDPPSRVWADTDLHWTCVCHPFVRVFRCVPSAFHCCHSWPIRKLFSNITVNYSFRIYGCYITNGFIHRLSQGWRRPTVYAAMVIRISCRMVDRFPNDMIWTFKEKGGCTCAPFLSVVARVMGFCTECGGSGWDG